MLSKINYKNWMLLLLQLAVAVAILVLLVKLYKYIRALIKRLSLMRRIHRICQNKGYELTTNKVYSSIIAQSSQPELIIKADNKIYEIKFFACLKYNNTYTLSDLSSFVTADNAARIMVSFGIPSVSPGLPLRTHEEQRLWNRTIVKTGKAYLKNEKKGANVAFSASEDTEKILCINPISVELQAVHTNRPEKLFDGDKFKGCTVYSGKALCEFLEGI